MKFCHFFWLSVLLLLGVATGTDPKVSKNEGEDEGEEDEQTRKDKKPCELSLFVERQSLKELNYAYRNLIKETTNGEVELTENVFHLQYFPSLNDFGNEFPWKMVHYLKQNYRLTADRIMFSNLAKLIEQWPKQQFIQGKKCPPFEDVKGEMPSNFTIIKIYEMRDELLTFVSAYMSWLKPMTSIIDKLERSKNKDKSDQPEEKEAKKEAAPSTDALVGQFGEKEEKKAKTSAPPHITEIVMYMDFMEHTFKSRRRLSTIYKDWRKTVDINKCLIKDIINMFQMTNRFMTVWNKYKNKHGLSTILRMREIADRSAQVRLRQPEMDLSVSVLLFFNLIFREIYFIADYIRQVNDDSQYDLLVAAVKVCVQFREYISLFIKKIDQVLEMYKMSFNEMAKSIRKLESSARMNNPKFMWPEPVKKSEGGFWKWTQSVFKNQEEK